MGRGWLNATMVHGRGRRQHWVAQALFEVKEPADCDRHRSQNESAWFDTTRWTPDG